MPVTVATNVEGFLEATAFYLAKCFCILREDGQKFTFTDHDAELTLPDGFTYSPMDSVNPSSRTESVGIADDASDLAGVISDDSITHEDLRSGRFDGAQVTEYIVDWRFPFAGHIRRSIYWMTTPEFDGETWKAKTEGITRFLKQRIGDTVTRNCRWDLGRNRFGTISTTSGCQFNVVAATKFSFAVASIQTQRRIFRITGTITDADGFYNLGRLVFASGANENHVNQIRDWTLSTKQIELQIRTPFDIEVGDIVDFEPGCDKTFETCGTKFSNAINFGGFLFVPGTDKSIQAPQR